MPDLLGVARMHGSGWVRSEGHTSGAGAGPVRTLRPEGCGWGEGRQRVCVCAEGLRGVPTPLQAPPQEATLESALAGLAPDAAAAAAALLRAEGVTAEQLRAGSVTDADLGEAGLAPDARAAIAAWRAAAAAP
jgi:hypothetical protein